MITSVRFNFVKLLFKTFTANLQSGYDFGCYIFGSLAIQGG